MYLMEYKIARDHPHWSIVNAFNKFIYATSAELLARVPRDKFPERRFTTRPSAGRGQPGSAEGVHERCVERSTVWMVVSDEKRATQFLPRKEPHDRRTGSAWHGLANPPQPPFNPRPLPPSSHSLSLPHLSQPCPDDPRIGVGPGQAHNGWVMSAC